MPFTPRVFDISEEGLDAVVAASESLSEIKKAELLTALTNLREWYRLMVKAASLTLEFEDCKLIRR